MSQLVMETKIIKGHIELNNIPLKDDTEVKVILIPKNEFNENVIPKSSTIN